MKTSFFYFIRFSNINRKYEKKVYYGSFPILSCTNKYIKYFERSNNKIDFFRNRYLNA